MNDTLFTEAELRELIFLQSQMQGGYFTEPDMTQKFINLAGELVHV